MPIDIDTLNEPQREAVVTTEGPLLVLAGAGSGKTRVLTYRIANLIENNGVAPWEILAITFTNKAANEMRERLMDLVGPHSRGMWVSTFHSMCVRMLRADAERLGFTNSFTIYDTDDQMRLAKTIMEEERIDPKHFPVKALMGRISSAKNELVMPGEFEKSVIDPVGRAAARVYTKYQQRLKAANAFDFDDLLVYAYLLLKNHPEVLEAYQNRFRYLMVDEYQDTNHAQYELTKLLAAKHQNIMVVGDDDQSIYSWRGADVRNILEFEQDYPRAQVVKLEQNYRSMGNILKAANEVIANNRHRKAKKLFTSSEDGEKIALYLAADERDEGRWIAGEIEKLRTKGFSYNQIAVFYRTNSQSRILEDMMLRAGVPYRIVGGTRFFDRAEIRDVMAYLTLVVNPADDMAAKRIINTPRRGLGGTTVKRIDEFAADLNIPFMEAAELAVVDPDVRTAARTSLAGFISLMKEAATYEGDLRKVVEAIIDKSGLIAALQAERSDEANSRIENIKEFLGVVDEFVATHDEDDAFYAAPLQDEAERTSADQAQEEPVRVLRGDSLADFTEWVRLRTDLDSVTDEGSAVTLMTVHSSKGLEFDCVFVAGMEETIFPHRNSTMETSGIEEERRLAYVAITRARKKLYLTLASSRNLFGRTEANGRSRFLAEIPSELLEPIGVGSAGFSGTGWEKRGSRRGIAGSGTEAGEGRVFGRSSAAGSAGRLDSRGGAQGRGSSSFDRKAAGAKESFAKGDMVDHKTFGRGKVVGVDGDTIQVRFAKSGQTKKLLKDFAPLVKIKG